MTIPVQALRMSLTTALVVSVCVVDSVSIAWDGSLMGSLNVMPSYNAFFEITTSTQAVNTAATFLGAIFIGPFTGVLIDLKGRKFGLYASALVNIIGAVIAGGAASIAMFIAGRFILGMGVGLGQTAAGTYVAETTASKTRPFALGLYFSCWAVGSLLAAGVSYGCSSLESNWPWRIPSILQAVPSLGILLILPFMPESPRWLIYKGRHEEAIVIVAKIMGTTVADVDVQAQCLEMIRTLEVEKDEESRFIFFKLLQSKSNRKRLFLALSIAPLAMLTGSNIITYYFGTMLTAAGITSSATQLQINVILSSWQLVVAVTGSVLADRIGRRALALGSLGSCSLIFYMLAAMTAKYGSGSTEANNNQSGVYGTIACIFLFLGAYSFGITPLTAMYAPEVLHYSMRASGIALQGILIKSCGVFVSFVFPYMFESIGWKTYIVNASWNILIWVYVWLQWVETRGLSLEQVDAVFVNKVNPGLTIGNSNSIAKHTVGAKIAN